MTLQFQPYPVLQTTQPQAQEMQQQQWNGLNQGLQNITQTFQENRRASLQKAMEEAQSARADAEAKRTQTDWQQHQNAFQTIGPDPTTTLGSTFNPNSNATNTPWGGNVGPSESENPQMGVAPGTSPGSPQPNMPQQTDMVAHYQSMFPNGKQASMFGSPDQPQRRFMNPSNPAEFDVNQQYQKTLMASNDEARKGQLTDAEIALKNSQAAYYQKGGSKTGVTTANLSWDSATPEQQRLAEAMVRGDVLPGDLGMRDRATIVTLANERAHQSGVPFQSYRGNINKGTETYFTTGQGGKTATSLNLALSHLDGVMNAYQDLENTDTNLLNKPINWLKVNTDNPSVIALGNKLTALQGELATVFKGSSGTDQEIGHWMKYLNDQLTPKQALAAGEAIDELLRSRLKGLNYQQSTSLGGGGGRERKLLSPEAESISKRYENPAGSPSTNAPMQIGRFKVVVH